MHCPDSLKVLFRLRDVRLRLRDAYVLPHHLPDHVFIAILIFKLLYVAALLPRLESLCPRIVEEPDLPGPLDHPEEVIRPHRILVLVCRQPEALPQFRRNEGRTDIAAWENSLIAGHYHEIGEVQGPGLKRAHYLESPQRLSLERHGNGAHKLLKQMDIGCRKNLQVHGPEPVNRKIELLGKMCLESQVLLP